MPGWYDLLDQGDLDTHVAAADPHTVYQRESEKNAASGYAGLDASGFLDPDQIPNRAVLSIADDRTLVVQTTYVVDSSTGVRTETLPAAPADGDGIVVKRSGANNVVIDRNGKTIDLAASNYTLSTDLAAVYFVYVASTNSWWVF